MLLLRRAWAVLDGQHRGEVFGKGAKWGSALVWGDCNKNTCFLTEELFGVLPFTYVCLPKSVRVYLFPQFDKNITFAAAPLVLTPFVR